MNDVKKRIKAKTNIVVRQVRCLADDAAFNAALSNNPLLAKAILVPILGRSDFEVKKAKTQFVVKGHGAMVCVLTVYYASMMARIATLRCKKAVAK